MHNYLWPIITVLFILIICYSVYMFFKLKRLYTITLDYWNLFINLIDMRFNLARKYFREEKNIKIILNLYEKAYNYEEIIGIYENLNKELLKINIPSKKVEKEIKQNTSKLEEARVNYNNYALKYNDKILMFPSCIIAAISKHKKLHYLRLKD